jgi:lipid II:glycine glycyltransferase (peptidoglycan interpeptide bridge formation enzyme)
MAQLPAELRRIIVFAGINAIERLAYEQFETHLLCLDRPDDVEALKGVMAEEKFHLNYVEAELERRQRGENGGFVATALEQARARFQEFQDVRRRETRTAVERIFDGATLREDRS